MTTHQLNLTQFVNELSKEIQGVNQKTDMVMTKDFCRGLAQGFSEASDVVTKWEPAPENGFFFSCLTSQPYILPDTWETCKAREREFRHLEDSPKNESWQQKVFMWHVLDTIWTDDTEITFYLRTDKTSGLRHFFAIASENPREPYILNLTSLKPMLMAFSTTDENRSEKFRMYIVDVCAAIWDMLCTNNTIKTKVLTS